MKKLFGIIREKLLGLFGGVLGFALLILALCIVPATIGSIFVTLIGGLDDAFSKWQRAGRWWLIILVGYLLSAGYIILMRKVRRNRTCDRYVSALMLYAEAKYLPEGNLRFSTEKDSLRSLLSDRVSELSWPAQQWFSDDWHGPLPMCPFEYVDDILPKWLSVIRSEEKMADMAKGGKNGGT